MLIGCSGTPTSGYDVCPLMRAIEAYLYDSDVMRVALVGVGHLGRAVLAFLSSRHPRVRLSAFDKDRRLTHRLLDGVHCYPVEQLSAIVREQGVRVGVVCVPGSEAQKTSENLVAAGVCGILNFAPVTLFLPKHIFVERIDISVALEKVAFFTQG